MAFTPNGQSVLTASNDGVVRLWRALGVERILPAGRGNARPGGAVLPQAAHRGSRRPPAKPGCTATACPVSPWFVRAMWGVRSRSPVQSPPTAGSAFSSRPPAPTQASPVTAPVRIVSVPARRLIRKLAPTAVFDAQLSPDGSRLFLQVQNPSEPPNGVGQPEVVNTETGVTVHLQAADPLRLRPGDNQLQRRRQPGRRRQLLWLRRRLERGTGRLVRQVDEGGEVSGVDLTPNGSRLLVGSWDSRATIWSVGSGHVLRAADRGYAWDRGAAFAAGGAMVVTDSLDDRSACGTRVPDRSCACSTSATFPV